MKSYLITDPKYYGSDAETLRRSLQTVLTLHHPDFALFRDKQTSCYPDLARTFIETCQNHEVEKIVLHGDPLLAHRFGANGIHLTSHQFASIAKAKSLGLYVIISTHTQMEVLMAENLGADAVTYSPIFFSPNKGEPKGLEDLKEIVDKMIIPIFALGGITTQEQINAVEACGAYGFASIRYFIP